MAKRERLNDDQIKHVHQVMRTAEGTREKVVADLEGLMGKLDRRLRLGGLSKAQSNRTKAHLRQATETIFSAYQDNSSVLTKDLQALARIEGNFYGKLLQRKGRQRLARMTVSPEGLKTIATRSMIQGATTKDWWSGQSRQLQQRFVTQVRLGLTQGESIDQIVSRVRGRPTGRKRWMRNKKGERVQVEERTGGIMEASKRDATALVRTAYMTVANNVLETLMQRGSSLFEGRQAVAVLDNKTTAICRARDKAAWDMNDDPLPTSPVQIAFPGPPPWHFGCRTILVPILLGDDLVAEETYDEWFDAQDEETQREILGPTRYELWKEGRLTMQEMVDQSGQALTVEELEGMIDDANDDE
jgi:hypothetical protein